MAKSRLRQRLFAAAAEVQATVAVSHGSLARFGSRACGRSAGFPGALLWNGASRPSSEDAEG
ncbi:hypothetical protein CTA1_4703 [Colletotrichum tanaceti]|uniref:Uncharacterized protein n=1 Tax=Colletotrichum tanaceti TaxID=1306861 RepID=A0A4V6DGM8_9PEZI|nr:hypothetical protein CTA1_4703 [Colletotrichum tanaceti]